VCSSWFEFRLFGTLFAIEVTEKKCPDQPEYSPIKVSKICFYIQFLYIAKYHLSQERQQS